MRSLILAVVWFAAVTAGFYSLAAYENTPGLAAATPTNQPTATPPEVASYSWQLLVFLHPHCPCSSATLDELVPIMAAERPALIVKVYFVIPASAAPGWEQSDLQPKAKRLPGVLVENDFAAKAALMHGARTSGQVVLYDPGGRLMYSGGLTRARGMTGENPGCQAILAALQSVQREPSTGPVFGCPLFNH